MLDLALRIYLLVFQNIAVGAYCRTIYEHVRRRKQILNPWSDVRRQDNIHRLRMSSWSDLPNSSVALIWNCPDVCLVFRLPTFCGFGPLTTQGSPSALDRVFADRRKVPVCPGIPATAAFLAGLPKTGVWDLDSMIGLAALQNTNCYITEPKYLFKPCWPLV